MCTHTHRDHSPAAAPLAQRTGAPIVGCAPLALDSVGARADASFDGDYRADRVLGDEEGIGIDGSSITAVATPGHTSNHLCFAYGDVLFTGDHVMGWSTTVVVPPNGNMGEYMRSLEKLSRRSDRTYYPAHGPNVSEPQEYVQSLIDHRLQREAQILGLITEEPRAVPEIVAEAYAGLDPRLFDAAAGSVLAHLLDLERRGLVVQEGERWRTR
jgi:glyoxylase-like metal-dependent hydrolase (beta-lactamase superfamily II)